MNAVTTTEARAVHTAASSAANVLQAADPSKHMILVPLSRLVLRPTGRNVRKTPRMSIPELAASIQGVGLLQNLIVIPAADGEHYEVVAGGRRLAALKLLAKKHRIAKDWEVPCLQVADGTARTASLTENVQREAMLGRVLRVSCLSSGIHRRWSMCRRRLFDARPGMHCPGARRRTMRSPVHIRCWSCPHLGTARRSWPWAILRHAVASASWRAAMARIIRAVPGHTDIAQGLPILVDERMAIIEPAFAYLLELATISGRAHSAQTLRTYAEHLHDWFDSLEQSGLEWSSIDESTIAAYRNRMLHNPSAHTGRPYARATVNGRIHTVCRFYSWACAKGWIERLPFRFVDVRVSVERRQSFLGHLHSGASVMPANVLTLPVHERLPRPLRVDQLRLVFAQLGEPYCLMAQWALATGMRRKELCGLCVFQVPETAHLQTGDHPLVGVDLSVTKGDRPRTAYPPIRLVDATLRYIDEVRTPLVRARRRQDARYRAPSQLFLNSRAEAVTCERLTAVFNAAFRRAGLNGSAHWLRHTFAMAMLVRLQRQALQTPDINPLKTVQVLLGHRSIQSTALYLRCVELHERELAGSIDYLYGELIDQERTP
ncbi:tyrosine-type recombinase/integrase [Delftia acidovorans]|uniref:tyrosine-type recombinase/integrase n=3 Tax=Burkholderiales TaxID=80840 RepID=UPI00359FC95C